MFDERVFLQLQVRLSRAAGAGDETHLRKGRNCHLFVSRGKRNRNRQQDSSVFLSNNVKQFYVLNVFLFFCFFLQNRAGLDTVEANRALGLPDDGANKRKKKLDFVFIHLQKNSTFLCCCAGHFDSLQGCIFLLLLF